MPTTRRQLLVSAALAPAIAACGRSPDYEAAVAETWSPAGPDLPEAAALVHYASLAANSHNTQPWRFAAAGDGIAIRADHGRATPVVDPDGHHLFVSLGCAAENLRLAAAALGRPAEIGALEGDALPVALGRGGIGRGAPVADDPLFRAITARQSSRTLYDGQALAPATLAALEAAATAPGVRAILITDRARIEQALEMIIAANQVQATDPAYVRELVSWIRFNAASALKTRDGLFAGSTGSPETPTWLGSRLLPFLLPRQAETDKLAAQIRSSAGLAVIVSERDDAAHWAAAGQAVQRFALQATALGLRQCFVNQAVEVAAIRPDFARWLGLAGGRPDLVLRFGTGPGAPRSLRRPVAQVLA